MVMGLGFLGGLILNLMPCVLPVIGLKILSFVQQAGHSRREALVLSQGEEELAWRPFSRKSFEELIAAQHTVMVDFTADWCMTCKTLEKLVLNTSRTHSAVRRHGVATLRADWTHASPEVTEMLELLGSKQVPVIAIFPAGSANEPIVFGGVYTQEMLLRALDEAGPSKMLHLTAAQARSNWK